MIFTRPLPEDLPRLRARHDLGMMAPGMYAVGVAAVLTIMSVVGVGLSTKEIARGEAIKRNAEKMAQALESAPGRWRDELNNKHTAGDINGYEREVGQQRCDELEPHFKAIADALRRHGGQMGTDIQLQQVPSLLVSAVSGGMGAAEGMVAGRMAGSRPVVEGLRTLHKYKEAGDFAAMVDGMMGVVSSGESVTDALTKGFFHVPFTTDAFTPDQHKLFQRLREAFGKDWTSQSMLEIFRKPKMVLFLARARHRIVALQRKWQEVLAQARKAARPTVESVTAEPGEVRPGDALHCRANVSLPDGAKGKLVADFAVDPQPPSWDSVGRKEVEFADPGTHSLEITHTVGAQLPAGEHSLWANVKLLSPDPEEEYQRYLREMVELYARNPERLVGEGTPWRDVEELVQWFDRQARPDRERDLQQLEIDRGIYYDFGTAKFLVVREEPPPKPAGDIYVMKGAVYKWEYEGEPEIGTITVTFTGGRLEGHFQVQGESQEGWVVAGSGVLAGSATLDADGMPTQFSGSAEGDADCNVSVSAPKDTSDREERTQRHAQCTIFGYQRGGGYEGRLELSGPSGTDWLHWTAPKLVRK